MPHRQDSVLAVAKSSGMSLRAGQGLTRFLTVFLAALFFASVISPVPAEPLGIVLTVGSRYVPGDDSDGTPLVVLQGSSLTYTNYDAFAGHSVTSDTRLPDEFSTPIFDSGVISFRSSAPVAGIAALAPGTYGFHCSIHEDNMHGTLTVVGL